MKRSFAFLGFITLCLSFASPVVSSVSADATSSAVAREQVGYDVSYPQCNINLPTNQYFGIVGINGGLASTTNPCLSNQLEWAKKSKPGSNQPSVQLYVNTGNPGEFISEITTWPKNNIDETGYKAPNPYGLCKGQNDAACSWQYGWNRSVEANLDRFIPAAKAAGIDQKVSSYTWWLDVETSNTWQQKSRPALARNNATLEGMTTYYTSRGATVGLYSTAQQWAEITGNTAGLGSPLNGLANWRPSGGTLSNAITNCSVAPLTRGGFISLTQYVKNDLDYNHSCI